MLQRYAGLPETGQLDAETIKLMGQSRCGVADFGKTDNTRRKRRYTLQGTYWKKRVSEIYCRKFFSSFDSWSPARRKTDKTRADGPFFIHQDKSSWTDWTVQRDALHTAHHFSLALFTVCERRSEMTPWRTVIGTLWGLLSSQKHSVNLSFTNDPQSLKPVRLDFASRTELQTCS